MNQLGKIGEGIALEYLKKKKYFVREINYRSFLGEIDLIGERSGEIVFIEVKTRKSTQYGYPEETVNSNKQKKIIKTASGYIAKKGLKEKNYRFDVILVIFSKTNCLEKIQHIENAFYINEKNNPFNVQQI